MTTRRIAFLALLVAALPAAARGEACYRPPDVRAEANVRLGLMLRERAAVCAARIGGADFAGLPQGWGAFETKNATQLKQAAEARAKAIERNFKAAADAEAAQSGRLIARFREEPAFRANCKDIAQMIEALGKEGWPGFEKRARLFEPEIRREIPPC